MAVTILTPDECVGERSIITCENRHDWEVVIPEQESDIPNCPECGLSGIIGRPVDG